MATVDEIRARLSAETVSMEDTVLRPLDDYEYEIEESVPLKPTRKVAVGVVAGAVTTVAVFVVNLMGVDVSAEVAAGVTTLVSFGLSWLIPEANQE